MAEGLITWAKDRETDRWVVVAPVLNPDTGSDWEPGESVEVTRKSGRTQRVLVDGVSEPYEVLFGPLRGQQGVRITPESREAPRGSSVPDRPIWYEGSEAEDRENMRG